jgi:hypothetical protein
MHRAGTNLKGIELSERSRTSKTTDDTIPLDEVLEKTSHRNTKHASGCRVQVWEEIARKGE